MKNIMPVTGWIAPEWVEFLIMIGALLLVAIGSITWVFFFRKTKHRRRKHRHHHRHHRQPGVSLAQTGGLPPLRDEEPPFDPPSPTAQP